MFLDVLKIIKTGSDVGLKCVTFLEYLEIHPKAFCYRLLNFPACLLCFSELRQTSLYARSFKSPVSGWIVVVCDSFSVVFSCKYVLWIWMFMLLASFSSESGFCFHKAGRFCHLMFFWMLLNSPFVGLLLLFFLNQSWIAPF